MYYIIYVPRLPNFRLLPPKPTFYHFMIGLGISLKVPQPLRGGKTDQLEHKLPTFPPQKIFKKLLTNPPFWGQFLCFHIVHFCFLMYCTPTTKITHVKIQIVKNLITSIVQRYKIIFKKTNLFYQISVMWFLYFPLRYNGKRFNGFFPIT
jgi:hypothetical protein